MSWSKPIQSRFLTVFGVCCVLLLLPAICVPQEEKFQVIEVPLSVHIKEVPSQRFLAAQINQILVAQQFAVLVGDRSAWVVRGAGSPTPLAQFAPMAKVFNWYSGGCAAGDRIVIGVGNYAEETKQEEENKSPGDFVGGPEPVGLLVISLNPPNVELIKNFKVVSLPPDALRMRYAGGFTTDPEACSWGGGKLYTGDFNDIAKLDLRARTAAILGSEDLGSDKLAMWKGPDALWYTAAQSEGFSWVGSYKNSGEVGKSYSPLNYDLTYPNSVLRDQGRLLISSAAGVIEIQPSRKTYVHYKLTEDKKKMAVYGLSVIDGGLWGTRDDGFVRFNLAAKSATIFRLQGEKVSNDVTSLGRVGGRWLVGTDKGLFEVRPEFLK